MSGATQTDAERVEMARCDSLLHLMPLTEKNAGKPCGECVALAELAGL